MCEGNPLVTVVILTTIFTALIPLGDSNITRRRPHGYQWNGSRVGGSTTRTSQSESQEHNNNVGSLDPHSSPPSPALTGDREKHASISLLETTLKKSRKLTTCHHVQWSDLNCLVGPIILDVDISQPVFQQLCPTLRGKFPSPTSCDLYVVCFARFLTINRCPSSQLFSPIQGKCVPAESYNCGDKNGISTKPKTVIELLTNHQVAFLLHHHAPLSRSRPRPRQATLLQTQAQNENKLRVMKLRSIRHTTEEDFCRPGEGIYPHPYSCHLYVHCAPGPGPGPWHGIARTFIRKCSAAPKLVFNPSLSICDWPSNVPECESPHLDHINHSHNSVSDNQDGNQFKLTSGPFGSPSRPPSFPLILGPRDDERKTAKGVRTRDGGTRRGCVVGGDYVKPHHHYCNKFEICTRGKVHLESCRLPLMFNPATKICDFPENVDCQSGNLDLEKKTTNGCDMGFDYITRHPDYCNKFIECENGMLYVKNCSLGTLYNPDISSCDESSQVKCGEPISLEHDTDVNSYPGWNGGRNSLESVDCTERVIRAHPEFCNKFLECEHGKVFVKNCGPGTVYNKEIQQCDWARNTKRSLQGACNLYQECISGIYRARKCNFPGSNYNPKMQECDNYYKCSSTNETVSRTTSAPSTTLMTATATTSQRTTNLSASKINRSTTTQSTNDESEINRTIMAPLLSESKPQRYTTVNSLLKTTTDKLAIITTTISDETASPAVTSTYAPKTPEAQETTTAPIVTKTVTPTTNARRRPNATNNTSAKNNRNVDGDRNSNNCSSRNYNTSRAQ